jgi:hypothetical protein
VSKLFNAVRRPGLLRARTPNRQWSFGENLTLNFPSRSWFARSCASQMGWRCRANVYLSQKAHRCHGTLQALTAARLLIRRANGAEALVGSSGICWQLSRWPKRSTSHARLRDAAGTGAGNGKTLLSIAVLFGKTRLIDNVVLGGRRPAGRSPRSVRQVRRSGTSGEPTGRALERLSGRRARSRAKAAGNMLRNDGAGAQFRSRSANATAGCFACFSHSWAVSCGFASSVRVTCIRATQ